MEPDQLSDCFTCKRRTDNFLSICDDSNTTSIDRILERHFWFPRNQFEAAVLCTSCWERIEDFHIFYCEVADVHQSDILGQSLPIKEEGSNETTDVKTTTTTRDWKQTLPLQDEVQSPKRPILSESVQVKLEVVDETTQSATANVMIEEVTVLKKRSDDESSETESEEESEEESSISIASRRRAMKRVAKQTKRKQTTKSKPLMKRGALKDALIKKHFKQLQCDRCERSFETFTELDNHSQEEHESAPTVMCCNRPHNRQNSLYHHLRQHNTVYKFHCSECNRSFKNVDGFNMHNVLNHTAEEDKRFRCHLCDRAFATETFLTSHLNWHATVQVKNIVCEKCNKYFSHTKMLELHMTSQHPETVPIEENSMELSFPNTNAVLDEVIASEAYKMETDVEMPTTETTTRKPSEPAKSKRRGPEDIAKEDELILQYCTLSCETCAFSTDTYNKLDQHYRVKHGKRGYATCCTRKFAKKSRLYEHACVHADPQHFKCEVCAKTFQNSFGLANHMMWKHTPDSEKPFGCDICGHRFWKDYLLKQHMEYHLALEEKKFACSQCDKFFGNKLLLKSHEQSVHGTSASWVCDVCAKGFSMKSQLEFHRLQHTQEGRAKLKSQCKHCKIWMKNIRSLRAHLRRCNADPISCDICGKECANRLALNSHRKFVHDNAQTYACSFCAKPFKRLLRLKEHEAGHTGDMLYKCEYCPRTCNSSSNMYTHKKVAHPEQWAAKMANRYEQRTN
ncbi:transcription factor grauzone-like [Uranotaenia lowii]|uniref:transcription factor grauzone-like n=1 Tax=Uranotaenia lowii TaxID=190385 RepID=UPI00247AE9EF|nr:transcription factor grauzone-like [Uranotaenia lowii]